MKTILIAIVTVVLFLAVLWSIGEDIRRIINRKDKTIWHSCNERPDNCSHILFVRNDAEDDTHFGVYYADGDCVSTDEPYDGFDYEWHLYVGKWLYIDDILKLQ